MTDQTTKHCDRGEPGPPGPELTYINFLSVTAQDIVTTVRRKDNEYGASWKRRGGIGAYMMLVRKSDRLEEQVKKYNYDIFRALTVSDKDIEALKDTLEDQIAYGLLILAEMRARNAEGRTTNSIEHGEASNKC